MKRLHKKAFTLIELLVVIAILGILMSVLISQFSGASESANATQCMANMRNLTVAARNFGMAEGVYPGAGTYPFVYQSSEGPRYAARFGWISWLDRSHFHSSSHWYDSVSADSAFNGQIVSTYGSGGSTEDPDPHFCITNGVLWKFTGRDLKTYVCPAHKNNVSTDNGPWWSYVLNSYFGYQASSGVGGGTRDFSGVEAPDRMLLFAEMQFLKKWNNITFDVSTSSSGDTQVDCTLQFDDTETTWVKRGKAANPEHIGFNHPVGKKTLTAHVAFADGHVTKLQLPSDSSSGNLKQITSWLCRGMDVTFNGKEYQKVEDTEQD